MAKRKQPLGKRLVREFRELRDALRDKSYPVEKLYYEWRDGIPNLDLTRAAFHAGFFAALKAVAERENVVVVNCTTSRTKRKAKP